MNSTLKLHPHRQAFGQLAGLSLRIHGLIQDARSHLAGHSRKAEQVLVTAFDAAVEEITDALSHIDDVWISPTGEPSHDEPPVGSNGWLCYGRPAVLEVLVGPELALYLP